MNREHRTVNVLFGSSGSGRSTFLKKVGASVGLRQSCGDSTTSTCTVYETEYGKLMDSPGYDDSQLRFTEYEVAGMVAEGIKRSEAQFVRFLIFESAANDVMKLRQTLAALAMAVGSVPRSAVVVFSKVDMSGDAARRERRKSLIRATMGQHRLDTLVSWQNFGLEEDFKAQIDRLRAALRTPAIEASTLSDLRSSVAARSVALALAASGKSASDIDQLMKAHSAAVVKSASTVVDQHYVSQAKEELIEQMRKKACTPNYGMSSVPCCSCFSFF